MNLVNDFYHSTAAMIMAFFVCVFLIHAMKRAKSWAFARPGYATVCDNFQANGRILLVIFISFLAAWLGPPTVQAALLFMVAVASGYLLWKSLERKKYAWHIFFGVTALVAWNMMFWVIKIN